MRRTFVVGTLFASSLAVYACVGDDPAPTVVVVADGGGVTNESGTPPPPPPPPGDPDSGNGAACDGGVTCNGVCVDTSSSQDDCGRCAHSCGTGQCTNGVCQPKVIVSDSDAGAVISSLTTDQGDDSPKGVAQHIFWSVAAGPVQQDNVTGGNTITLSTTASYSGINVVVSGANAFWFGRNFGGPPQPVLKGQVNTAASQAGINTMNASFLQSITYDPTNKYVVGNYAVNGTQHGAFKCGPIDNTPTCTSMITFSGQPGGNISNDGTKVYFSDPSDGLILWSTVNGGSAGTYVQNQASPTLTRVDGNYVYWFNSGTKTIQRGPLGSVTTPKQMASTSNAIDGLAADAVNVYWTDSTTGTVNYAPVTGAGPNTPYVNLGAGSGPMHLVRDAAFLYFTYKNGIYRVALP